MHEALGRLLAKEAIIEVLNSLFVGTDDRDWERVRACLAPSVAFDMTSLTGGAPAQLTPEEITGAWREGLAPITAVHHQVGNYRVAVDGNQATAFCYGIALHYRKTPSGRNTRMFVGSYDFQLVKGGDRWQIKAFRFTVKFVEGNLELEKD